PQPGLIARQIGIRGPAATQAKKPDTTAGQAQAGGDADSQSSDASTQQQENRQALQAYYMQHGLKQPQRLLIELQAQKLIRAVNSERQLDEVLTDFWFNHFNIFWGKGQDKWMTTQFEMNAIRPHVLGKFKDLVTATAKSPAMLFYLDNAQTSAPDAKPPRMNRPAFNRRPLNRGPFGTPRLGPPNLPPASQQPNPNAANQKGKRKSGINENYARELMELHTMGVEGGYTQKDVQEVARCLTGWTIDGPRRGGQFVFRDWMHDNGEKTVLGHKIPAGGGQKDGEMVIGVLRRHH